MSQKVEPIEIAEIAARISSQDVQHHFEPTTPVTPDIAIISQWPKQLEDRLPTISRGNSSLTYPRGESRIKFSREESRATISRGDSKILGSANEVKSPTLGDRSRSPYSKESSQIITKPSSVENSTGNTDGKDNDMRAPVPFRWKCDGKSCSISYDPIEDLLPQRNDPKRNFSPKRNRGLFYLKLSEKSMSMQKGNEELVAPEDFSEHTSRRIGIEVREFSDDFFGESSKKHAFRSYKFSSRLKAIKSNKELKHSHQVKSLIMKITGSITQ